MKKPKEYYYLVRIDDRTDEKEYFDFNTMYFTYIKGNIASLSSIDCLTTLFDNQDDFEEYIYRDLDTFRDYAYKIQYTDKNGTVKYIPVVWNDFRLNALSKVAHGKVDYSINQNLETLLEILYKIKDHASGTARKIVNNKKPGSRISDANKALVEVIASSDKKVPFDIVKKSFSTYTEARALYLSSIEEVNYKKSI